MMPSLRFREYVLRILRINALRANEIHTQSKCLQEIERSH